MIEIKYKTFSILTAFLVTVWSLCSCSSSKDTISYFQDAMQVSETEWAKQFEIAPRIKINDEISIIVNAIDQTAAAAFNKSPYSQQKNESQEINTVPQIQTYRVNERGEIGFPVLGTLRVKEMTTLELQDYLESKIKDYVKDPIVTVSFIDLSVVVLGEVTNPGISQFKGNRATILEAIGQCGDLTIYGRRDNVMLIRENEGKREVHKIDLTKADFINSPYYYLQQNDVIYVSPNQSKQDSSKYNNLKSYNISLVGTIVSCVSVLATLAIAIWK